MHGWLSVGWIWLLAWIAVARFPNGPGAEIAGWWRWVSYDYAISLACLIWASWLLASRVRRWVEWLLYIQLPLTNHRRWMPATALFTAVGAGVFLVAYLPGHSVVILGLFGLREWWRWQESTRLLAGSGSKKIMER